MDKISFISVQNVNYCYPEKKNKALSNINVTIQKGEFVLLAGGSGSGKSTLVKAIAGLVPEFYGGKIQGNILIDHQDIFAMDRKERLQKIGMVFQDPENQLIMTKVEQEIAFGLENMGLSESLMKRRIFEVSGILSLGHYLEQNIPFLSGGVKQKVALASILAMQPEVLILDEPTSQLDPVAGEEILTIVRRLNEENGITVILIEQRLERCFHLADRYLFMEKGQLVLDASDKETVALWAKDKNIPFLPPMTKLFSLAGCTKELPMTVKEGRSVLRKMGIQENIAESEDLLLTDPKRLSNNPVLEMKHVWYVYQNGHEALKNINLKFFNGEITVIMGENAAGKTTLAKQMNRLLEPSRGQILLEGMDISKMESNQVFMKVVYLSQNPNDYLFADSVLEEVLFTQKNFGEQDESACIELIKQLGLKGKEHQHPRDLSSGERQRVALAAVLISDPQVIILDEPTRGLDYDLKIQLGELLLQLKAKGKAVIIITHDVEFAAEYADQVLLMSRGSVIAHGATNQMLTRSSFYSPQVSKLFYRFNNEIVTLQQGLDFLKSNYKNGRLL